MATEKSPPESNPSTDKGLLPGPIVFVIGPPGSGKGTLCSRLCQQIPDSFAHLSVGDHLRELCSYPRSEILASGWSSTPFTGHVVAGASQEKPGSSEVFARWAEHANVLAGRLSPKEIVEYVQESKLLPADTIIPLLKDKLVEEQSSPTHGWLIDGFPRSIETARAFEKEIKAPIRLIVLHCSPPFARERFLKRRRSSTDDHGFFDKRLKEYDEKLPAILDRYRDIIINVHVNGTKDESWGNLVQAVRTLPEFEGLRMFEPAKEP